MEERAKDGVAFSHMAVLAAISVVTLISIGSLQAWKVIAKGNSVSVASNAPIELASKATTPWEGINWQAPLPAGVYDEGGLTPSASAEATADKDGLSNIEGNVVGALLGSYTVLAESGLYTPEGGEKIAEDIATTLRAKVSYPTYAAVDLKTDTDISYNRMLVYRSDLREALEPLLANPGYELSLFANYIESRDTIYTDRLRQAAKNYRAAVENAAIITVPEDALSYHVGILNSLSEFGATIEAMANHADDAFASVALLATYNTSERNLMTSFDSLASYQKSKRL